jgi:hypothetical protein
VGTVAGTVAGTVFGTVAGTVAASVAAAGTVDVISVAASVSGGVVTFGIWVTMVSPGAVVRPARKPRVKDINMQVIITSMAVCLFFKGLNLPD